MKSTSQSALILVLVMVILVLGSLFWFMYADYAAVRSEAETAVSRATRVAAAEQEAGQIRAEADQIMLTRTALEADLATAVISQETLEQEAVTDQQTIQQLETRVAEQIPEDSVPEVIIVSPRNGQTQPLTEAVELTVAAFDPIGINAIKIIFDENPPLDILVGGKTSAIIQESWPLSAAGEHTAVVTAVNRNNVSSQITSVTIITENRPTSQQISEAVTNIIGPAANNVAATAQAVSANEMQAALANEADITPLILQALNFDVSSAVAETAVWGHYCTRSRAGTAAPDAPDTPAQELALVQAQVQAWQASQFQISQQITNAADDDARAALCALAAGHERWVLEEYIRRAPAARQDALRQALPPLPLLDGDVLTGQQNFGAALGPNFINALVAASGTTAVLDAWNRPPQSSAAILNPAQYAAAVAVPPVSLPDLTAVLDDWKLVTNNVLGAFMLDRYLGNFAEEAEVKTAVSGWQGDRYALYQQGDAGPVLLALQINWLSEQDTLEFADVWDGSINGRLPQAALLPNSPENSTCWTGISEETICLLSKGTQSLLVHAPQATIALEALAAFSDN